MAQELTANSLGQPVRDRIPVLTKMAYGLGSGQNQMGNVSLNRYGYLHTTPSQDTEAINEMKQLIGTREPFDILSYNCHNFAQDALHKYTAQYPNQFSRPTPTAATYLTDLSYLDDE